MIAIQAKNNDMVLTIPKYFFNNKSFQNILSTLEIEKSLEDTKMTNQQALELSEEVKENWWKENGGKFLEGII